MTPTRYAHLAPTPPVVALTTTARGMLGHTMTRAAKQAFGELFDAIHRAGLGAQVASCIGISPDDPQGADDPDCRFQAGVVFGLSLAAQQGRCEQPDLPLTGTLAWLALAGGRHAVFTHRGPYDTLHQTWGAIYRDWLPASGEQLRAAPPFELILNDPGSTAPPDLLTEIWLPLV